jgi:hypothetical protein
MFGTMANAKSVPRDESRRVFSRADLSNCGWEKAPLHQNAVARGEAGVEGTVVRVEIESSYMKRLSLIIAAFFLVIGAAVSRTDMTAELKRTAVDINTQGQAKDGRTRVLMAISSETGVPVTTLQTEQSANGLGYGDLLIANLVASESGKNVSEVVAVFKAGQGGWGKIANDLGLNLGQIVSKARQAEQAALNAQSKNATGSDKSQEGPAMGRGRGTGFQEQQNSRATSAGRSRP